LPEGYPDENNHQPLILRSRYVVSHNGTISNDVELVKKYGFEMQSQIDSEVLLHLYSKFAVATHHPLQFLTEVVGGVACVLVDAKSGIINAYRNFKPLWVYDGYARWFHSEKENLVEVFGEEEFGDPKYQEIENFSAYSFSRFDFSIFVKHEKIYTATKSHLPVQSQTRAYAMCSGGIDSVTAAFVAKYVHHKDVTLVNFDYGQKSFVGENHAVQTIAEKFGFDLLSIDFTKFGQLGASPLTSADIAIPTGLGSVESTLCWVPARNLMFVSYMFALAEANGVGQIYTGWNLEESGVFPDNDIDFFHLMNKVSNYGTLTRPNLILVLEKLMKPEILHLGTSLNVPYDLTWSCDSSLRDDQGKLRPCGICGCCMTRRYAFKVAGLVDKQDYLDYDYERYVWDKE